MIGNDIIALDMLNPYPPERRQLWIRKVLTELEIKQLPCFPDQENAIWPFWALKESAYKVCFRYTLQRKFIPKKLICQVTSLDTSQCTATIQTPIGTMYGQVEMRNQYCHALVSMQEILLKKVTLGVMQQANNSKHIKEKLLSVVSETLHLKRENLSLVKSGSIPGIHLNNKDLGLTVSLSHHHHWGAFAFL